MSAAKYIIQQRLLPVLTGFVRLLWPLSCLNCGGAISQADGSLCQSCWDELMASCGGDYCRRCGRDVSKYGQLAAGCGDCLGKDFHFDAIARSGVYKDTLRKMILAFKAADRTELSGLLHFLVDSAFAGADFVNDIDLVVPVPLHWTRQLRRGYNQSYLIAKALKNRSIKMNTDLVRMRNTKQQASLTEARRRANVAGAFAARKRHSFAGKKICLIDDIKTTGATLNECARVLKKAGAIKVYAAVLAVAGQSSN